MVFYKRKPKTRAKRNFKRVARKMVRKTKPRFNRLRSLGDTTQRLKITMHRELYKKEFVTDSDQSMWHDIIFNVVSSLNTTTPASGADGQGTNNAFYHPDAARLLPMFQQYKCTCIVMKFTRPNVPISYNNGNMGSTLNIQKPTIPVYSKILHTKVDYAPDGSPSSGIVTNKTLQLRQITTQPGSFREMVDDGRKICRNHGYQRSFTRVWKPATSFEKQWIHFNSGNLELCRGGIHLRFQKDHPVDLDGVVNNNSNYNYNENVKLFDIEATVYLSYKDRT